MQRQLQTAGLRASRQRRAKHIASWATSGGCSAAWHGELTSNLLAGTDREP